MYGVGAFGINEFGEGVGVTATSKTVSATTTPIRSLSGIKVVLKTLARTVTPLRALLKATARSAFSAVATLAITKRTITAKRVNARSAPTPIEFVGFVSTSSVNNSSDKTLDLTNLSGGSDTQARAGDLVVVADFVAAVTTDVNQFVVTSGYTEWVEEFFSNFNAANTMVAAKVMGSTPDTSVVVNGQNACQVIYVYVWRNVDPTTPQDVALEVASSASGSLNPPAIQPRTPGAVVLVAGMKSNSTVTTAFSGHDLDNFNQRTAVSGTDCRGAVGSHEWRNGNYNPGAWTGPGGPWIAVTTALRPKVGTGSGSGTSGGIDEAVGVASVNKLQSSSNNDVSTTPSAGVGRAISRTLNRAVAVAVSIVRSIAKLISRAADAAAYAAGNFISGGATTPWAVDSSTTPAGAIARSTWKPISRTASVAAALARAAAKIVSRTVSGTASILHTPNKRVAASTTPTTRIVRAISRTLLRSVSVVVSEARIVIPDPIISLATTSAATLRGLFVRGLNPNVSAAATIVRRTGKPRQASSSSNATLGATLSLRRTLSASVTPVVSIARLLGKTFSRAASAIAQIFWSPFGVIHEDRVINVGALDRTVSVDPMYRTVSVESLDRSVGVESLDRSISAEPQDRNIDTSGHV